MSRQPYSFQRRQRDLAKAEKREAKRAARLARKTAPPMSAAADGEPEGRVPQPDVEQAIGEAIDGAARPTERDVAPTDG